jgi:hypothetical protein
MLARSSRSEATDQPRTRRARTANADSVTPPALASVILGKASLPEQGERRRLVAPVLTTITTVVAPVLTTVTAPVDSVRDDDRATDC